MSASTVWEMTFWKEVYVAAIRNGKYNSDAMVIANQAIAHYREFMNKREEEKKKCSTSTVGNV